MPARTRAGLALSEVVSTGLGTAHRDDPVSGHTGGPAGNARLTAWTGLLLLAAFGAECATLLGLRQLIGVHILVGAFLVPPALLKTGTTGWRIARYYLGCPAYRRAGPPPLLLRVLGPLVIVTALAVLGTGLALIALGRSGLTPLISVAGVNIDALTLHQAAFVGWLAITGLHVLARTVPAVQLARGTVPHSGRLPGAGLRAGLLLTVTAAGIVAGFTVLHLSGVWTAGH